MYKILIVEDDPVISEALKKHLTSWGYTVFSVNDFSRVIETFAACEPQLVLLDIGLPFHNGYHWCAEIRKISQVPVIFISAASDNMDIVLAINMGGDDFIAKPFDLHVLTSKVQAMLRRAYDFGGATSLIEHRGAIFSPSALTLHYGDAVVELTKNESKILQALLENKGKVVSRDTLMTKLWQTDHYVDENTLTVNIARLRRKLEDTGLREFISTKKGIGYLIQ